MSNINNIEPPLVSVIIPYFNIEDKSKIFQTTFNSVIKQSYPNIEIVLINDGSTDGSEIIVENLISRVNDPRILLNHNKLPYNSGPSVARNKGVEVSRGDIVAFLDCDDVFMPEYLNESIFFFKANTGVDVVLTFAYYYVNFYGLEKVYMLNCLENLNEINFEELVLYIIKNNFPIPMGSGMICRKGVFSKVLFDEFLSKKTAEDVDFGYQLLLNGYRPFFQIKPLIVHRSYLKHISRSRAAFISCDEYIIHEYLFNKSVLFLLEKIKTKIEINRINQIYTELNFKKVIFEIKRLVFENSKLKALKICGLNPTLLKHGLRYIFLKVVSRNHFAFLFLTCFSFLRINSNNEFRKRINQYIYNLQ